MYSYSIELKGRYITMNRSKLRKLWVQHTAIVFICMAMLLTSFPFMGNVNVDVNAEGVAGAGDRLITKKISQSYLGEELDDKSTSPVVSSDGKYVAFSSLAEDIIPGAEQPYARVSYLHDLANASTQLVSKSSQGDFPNNAISAGASVSVDGRYTAFASMADNLVEDHTYYGTDAYVHDTQTSKTELVSLSENGDMLERNSRSDGLEGSPIISGNGKHIVFATASNGVVSDALPTDTGEPTYRSTYNLYVRDLENETTILINRNEDGTAGEPSAAPAQLPKADISADGRFIVFSIESRLVSGDTNSRNDIYLYDRDRDGNGVFDENFVGAIEKIPSPSSGYKWLPAISEDGRYVAYDASYLYVYDRQTGNTVTSSFKPYDGSSGASNLALSGDGRYLVFEASADDILDPNDPIQDTNDFYTDIYRWDWQADKVLLVSRSTSGEIGNYDSTDPSINFDGSVIAYASYATNLADPADVQVDSDIFVTTIDQGSTEWPVGSTLTAGTIGKNQVELSWTPATDDLGVVNYHIYKDGVAQSPSVTGQVYNYTASGLDEATTYVFRVEAEDVSGNITNDGPELTVTTKGETAKATLSAQVLSNSEIKLSWDKASASSDTESYLVMRSADSGSNYTQLDKIEGLNVTTYLDTGLTANTTYTYQIIAVDNLDIETDYTDPVDAQTSGLQIDQMLWQVPQTGYPYARALLGETLSVQVKGEPNRTVEAELTFASWYDEHSTELISPAERVEAFALTETGSQSGMYEGELILPAGTTELIQIKTSLSDGAGAEVSLQEPINLKVSGSLELTLNLAEPSNVLDASRISVFSDSLNDGANIAIHGSTTPLVGRLAAANDYKIRVTDQTSGRVIAEKSNVEIRAGMIQTETVSVEVPPTVSVTVINPDATIAYQDRGVQITAYDPNTGKVLGTADNHHKNNQSLRPVDGVPFFIGDQIRLKVGELLPPYKGGQDEVFTLSGGENEFTIYSDWLELSELEGDALSPDGSPTPNVQVTMIQDHPEIVGRTITKTVVTDQNGHYSMQVLPGDVRLSAVLLSDDSVSISNVDYHVATFDQTYTKNLQLEQSVAGTVKLRIKTKYKNAAWQVIEPDQVDWRVLVHYGVTVQDARGNLLRGSLASGYPLQVSGVPGDELEVCIDGRQSNLPKGCTTAVFDQNMEALAEIELIQEGANVKADLILDNGQAPSYMMAKLYKEISFGGLRLMATKSGSDASFEIWASDLGDYVLQVQDSETPPYKSAQSHFSVTANEDVISLETLTLTDEGLFAGKTGNAYRSLSGEIVPGDQVTFRANYLLSGQNTVNNAVLILDIPDGFDALPGSVIIDGQPAGSAATIVGSTVEVELGTITENQSGVVRVSMSTTHATSTEDGSTRATIRYIDSTSATVDEIIGNAPITFVGATIQAPASSSKHTIKVQGTAPLNSQVDIYVGNTLIDSAATMGSSYWKKTITLPDTGSAKIYRLHVVATDASNQSYSSQDAVIYVDANWPVFSEMTMEQTDGRKVIFDPSEGAARFPYVMVPNTPFIFTMTWDHPDKISHVKVRYGDEDSKDVAGAERMPDGTFRAVMNAVDTFPEGKLHVFYRTEIDGLTNDLTYEEIVQIFPSMRNKELEAVIDQPMLTPADYPANASYTKTDTLGGLPVTIEQRYVTLELPENTPAIDSYEYEGKTVPIYAMDFGSEEVDGKLNFRLSVTIPTEDADSLDMSDTFASAAFEKPGQVQIAGKIGVAIELTKFIFDVKGAATAPDVMENSPEFRNGVQTIQFLYAKAQTICDDALRELVLDSLRSRFKYLQKMEVMRAGMIFMPPIIDDQTDNKLKRMQLDLIDRAKEFIDGIIFDGCDKPKGAAPAAAAAQYEADPVPIHDPSGYVFEALEMDRLENVTATLLHQDAVSNEWNVWDAEWYGQENPQTTDPLGKYGWDVPEGQWQVMYEKPGYETAYSDVLTVLPPHFDVNVSMKSLAVPQVKAIRADADGSRVNVYFDKPMLADAVDLGTVVVRVKEDVPGSGEVIVGTVDPVDAEIDAYGAQVTKTIRFTPDTTLTLGETYEVTVAGMTQSYAGTALGDNVVELVTVEADTTPPAEVTDVVAMAAKESALLTWTSPGDVDFAHAHITWQKGDDVTAQTADVPAGQGWYALDGLVADETYTVKVMTIDLDGNVSTGVTVLVTPFDVLDSGLDPDDGNGGNNPGSGNPSGDGGSNYIPDNTTSYEIVLTGNAQEIQAFGGDVLLHIAAGIAQAGDVLRIEKVIDPNNLEGSNLVLPVNHHAYSPIYHVYIVRQGKMNPVTASALDSAAIQIEIKVDDELQNGIDDRKLAIYYLPGSETMNGESDWQYMGGLIGNGENSGYGNLEGTTIRVRTGDDPSGYYAIILYDQTFPDLAGHWSQGDVEVLISHHMIHGVNEQEFQPNREITRAEMAQLIVASLHWSKDNVDADDGIPTPSPFADVAADAWYADPIRFAFEHGIIAGYDGNFRPKDSVTREEMAVMLTQAFELTPAFGQEAQAGWDEFVDTDIISAWAKDALTTLYAQGLMNGISETQLAPAEFTTRAQAAVMLLRLLVHTDNL